MSTLREAAQAALTAYEKFRDVDDIDGLDDAIDRLRAALSAPDVPDVLDELPMPPAGHPLYKLGDRLAHYLDDDKFNECERLLLEGWNHDRIDRKTGEDWLDIEPPEEKPVAWQVRWIDPEEGPGAWRFCLDPSEADYYANREDHDWRPLYTHPPRDEWRPASEPPEDAMFSRGAVAAIVAGAIYDFAGFMTTRPVSVSIGASDACGPVVDLITSFAEKRGLDLEEAAVQSWNLCIGRDVQPPTEGE